jgi:hypothetical protein
MIPVIIHSTRCSVEAIPIRSGMVAIVIEGEVRDKLAAGIPTVSGLSLDPVVRNSDVIGSSWLHGRISWHPARLKRG